MMVTINGILDGIIVVSNYGDISVIRSSRWGSMSVLDMRISEIDVIMKVETERSLHSLCNARN